MTWYLSLMGVVAVLGIKLLLEAADIMVTNLFKGL
jgi:hypothetical protein